MLGDASISLQERPCVTLTNGGELKDFDPSDITQHSRNFDKRERENNETCHIRECGRLCDGTRTMKIHVVV